jgi:hypothetical protein
MRLTVMCEHLPLQDPKDKSEKEELDMFFPFDPYLLERSANYLDLDHSYVTWASRHEHAYASDDDEEVGHRAYGKPKVPFLWDRLFHALGMVC